MLTTIVMIGTVFSVVIFAHQWMLEAIHHDVNREPKVDKKFLTRH